MSASRKYTVSFANCEFLHMSAFNNKCNTYSACFCFGLSTRTSVKKMKATFVHIKAKLGQDNLLRMVR